MSREFGHVVLCVPISLIVSIKNLISDDTKLGDEAKEVLQSLHRDSICPVSFGGVNYFVFLITVEDNLTSGNLQKVLSRWPDILVVLAYRQNGLQIGQSYNQNGDIVGVPTFSLTPARRATLVTVWPPEFKTETGKFFPPNISQGQQRWFH